MKLIFNYLIVIAIYTLLPLITYLLYRKGRVTGEVKWYKYAMIMAFIIILLYMVVDIVLILNYPDGGC